MTPPFAEAPGPDGALPPLCLEVLPFPCAIYGVEGTLHAANQRFTSTFASVDPHALDCMLATTRGRRSEQFQDVALSGRWYSVQWTPVSDLYALFTAIDITARMSQLDRQQQRKERLLFASRLMSVGELTATLAHELNQPLSAIVNYVSIAQAMLPAETTGESPPVARALQAARTQALHASAVVARMREFVKSREPKRVACDTARLVANVINLLELEIERQEIQVEFDTSTPLPPVHADLVMIEQVMMNLVKNAIDAMRELPPARRLLFVGTRQALDGNVEVLVGDRGPGLSKEGEAQMFAPFYTTKADGLGIGLAICRSIVEYHQGWLRYQAREGGGSLFVFSLPPAPVQVQEATA